MGGQLLYRHRNEQGVVTNKYIDAQSAREAFTTIPIDSGWLPSNILREGTFRSEPFAVIHFPVARRKLWLDDEAIELKMPGGIFAGFGNSFYIFAVKKPFTIKEPLFHYPLPNISGAGAICFGSFRPESTVTGINSALNLFFRSAFNDHHINNKSKKSPEDVRLTLRATKNADPLSDLIRLNQTSEEAIDRYLLR